MNQTTRARNVLAVGSFVIVLIAACGSGVNEPRTPAGGKISCTSDSECVVANQTGCCNACPEQPFGLPSLNAEQQKNKCAKAECNDPSTRIECPKVEPMDAYVAVCKDGTCNVKKK